MNSITKILKIKSQNQRAFTLIELIIYIAIVMGVLLIAFNFSWEIIYGNVKSQAIREVQQNSRLAIEKIARAVLNASLVNNPAIGNSSNLLSLTMQDVGLDPTLFEVIVDKLSITQAGGGPYELTNDRVQVTNLQFTNVSYLGTPGAIKVQMTIKHVNPNNLSQYEVFLDTEKTISLRK